MCSPTFSIRQTQPSQTGREKRINKTSRGPETANRDGNIARKVLISTLYIRRMGQTEGLISNWWLLPNTKCQSLDTRCSPLPRCPGHRGLCSHRRMSARSLSHTLPGQWWSLHPLIPASSSRSRPASLVSSLATLAVRPTLPRSHCDQHFPVCVIPVSCVSAAPACCYEYSR